MTLEHVSLADSPRTILDYLAVVVAVRAAVGLGAPSADSAVSGNSDGAESGGSAATSHPTWSDENGSWLTLVLPGDGRALLAGWHADESETEASGTSLDGGTDLIDTAPGWWRRGIDHARARRDVLGFLYGWDGAAWWRAPYDTADGFDPDFFPVTRDSVAEQIEELAADTLLDDPAPEAVDALLAAGTALTAEQLEAALHTEDGWPEVDVAAGVRAAQAFGGYAERLLPAPQHVS